MLFIEVAIIFKYMKLIKIKIHLNILLNVDIKGANVLVDKEGICKLADFGSAKKIVLETQ